MKHKRTRREKIVAEYMAGETTYRELGTKYGYGAATVYRWVKEAERDRKADKWINETRRIILAREITVLTVHDVGLFNKRFLLFFAMVGLLILKVFGYKTRDYYLSPAH